MANYKGILIGVGVVAGIVGALFGTGIIRLNKNSDSPGSDETGAGSAAEQRRGGKKSDLESLAYLGEIPLEDATKDLAGVQRNDPGTYPGFFVANAAGRGGRGDPSLIREAALYDQAGKEVNRWQSDVPSKKRGWAIARMDSAGYLYVVVADGGLLKLDWTSNIAWLAEGRFHHDMTVLDDDSVAVLAERRVVVPGPQGSEDKVRLLEHGVVFFTSDGEMQRQVWMHDIFEDNDAFQEALRRAVQKRGRSVIATDASDESGATIDAFHANSIVILPRDVRGLGKTGDILISLRNMNTVASIDHETLEPIWVWGPGEIYKQHDATLTPEGHVIMFDNQNRARNSRTVVVDPTTNEIVRTVGGQDASGTLKYFSKGRGISQSLPNGNIMVVVSNEGRAFEVNGDDTVLWEYWSPWKNSANRRPIRGTRLEGKVQTAVASIVAGEASAPAVSQDDVKRWTVDLHSDNSGDAPPSSPSPEHIGAPPKGDEPPPKRTADPEVPT